jgi:hypothetical protein
MINPPHTVKQFAIPVVKMGPKVGEAPAMLPAGIL